MLLAPVDAEGLEPLLYLVGERGGATRGIAEDEHRDTPRLSIPIGLDLETATSTGGDLQRPRDLRELARRPRAEEGKRDVEMLARDDASPVPELTLLPGAHAVEHPLGKPQGEEEAQSLIPLHATG